jgi:hypothetical protein
MPRQTFPGSSALAGADYDPERKSLSITFKGGRSYTYNDVPPDVYEQLCSADSPGTFWRSEIKDAYS